MTTAAKTTSHEVLCSIYSCPVTAVDQAYAALQTAAERMGRANYAAQMAAYRKARRLPSTFRFHVTDEHAAVVAAMPRLLSGEITPDDAMGLLLTHGVLNQRTAGSR